MNNEVMEIVFQSHDGEWYFYDETWSDVLGPFMSEYSAHKGLVRYCVICLDM